jgi:hypothetical protein
MGEERAIRFPIFGFRVLPRHALFEDERYQPILPGPSEQFFQFMGDAAIQNPG